MIAKRNVKPISGPGKRAPTSETINIGLIHDWTKQKLLKLVCHAKTGIQCFSA